MQTKKPKSRILFAALIFGLLAAILSYSRVLYNIDKLIADPIYQEADWTDNSIRIIAIDEQTLAEYGDIGYWSRDTLATLINKLNSDENLHPDVIVLDMLLIAEKDKAGDDALAEACAKLGNVVVGANIVYRDAVGLNEAGYVEVFKDVVDSIEYPYAALKKTAIIGFANAVQDTDGYIRYAQTTQTLDDGTVIPSLAFAAYEKYCELYGLEVDVPETVDNNIFAFPFSGKPSAATNHFFEIVSMKNVLNGSVDTRAFANSIVLVGAFAPGMGDAYNVAILRGQQMYGVEVHANILQALMQGKTAIPVNTLLYSIIITVICVLYYLLTEHSKTYVSTLALIGLIAGEIFLGRFLFDHGWVISLIEMPIVVILAYAFHLINQYVAEAVRKAEVINAFKTYVAPQIVEQLSVNGEKFDISLKGENRDIAVLFCDIRGFTPLSEGLKPEQIVDILNHYLTLTTNSIFANLGTLDKFVGDATMAIFNAPCDLDDYVYRAVCAGRDILSGRAELERMTMEKYGRPIAFGIGIHVGDAVVGNIGCKERMDFTAIGDAVNTAARLESNAGPGQLLISEKVYRLLADRLRVTPCGNIPLKGKTELLYVFQVDKILDKPLDSFTQAETNMQDLQKPLAPTKSTKGGGHLILDEEGNILGVTED